MAVHWKDYQEEAASFFRSIGLNASTDAPVKGVRTSHDIDVLVKSVHAGFDITWIVECKHWKTPVSKLHVLALREIVQDIGADRGILLSEEGFQSGAVEAATLTNVQVTSLAQLTASATNDIYMMRLQDLFNRIEDCSDRYWDIPKDQRIEQDFGPMLASSGIQEHVPSSSQGICCHERFAAVIHSRVKPLLQWSNRACQSSFPQHRRYFR
jgi:restriction system protein